MNFLRKIDIYGVSIALHVDKQERFKSVAGGVSTVLTTVLIGLGAYLFGTDFFHKTNPRVVTQTRVPSISEMIYPSSTNYTILWNYEKSDGSLFPLEEARIQPICQYFDYVKQEGDLKIKVKVDIPPIKCSSTRATENPLLSNFDLSKYYCIDWDFVKEEAEKQTGEPYTPRLGGFWDEPEVAYFGCRFTSHRLVNDKFIKMYSNEEIKEWAAKNTLFFNFFYPSFYFDTDSLSKPLVKYYTSYYYLLNVRMQRTDRFFFQLATLKDDQGWIFKDEKVLNASSKVDSETDFGIQELENDVVYTFYKKFHYFNKKQLIFTRSYMKIQDLGAILGGFVKIVVLCFRLTVVPFTRHSMLLMLGSKLDSKEKDRSAFSLRIVNQSNNQIVPEKEKTTNSFNFGFLTYIWSKFIARNSKFEFFDNFKSKLKAEIGVESLINVLENRKTEDR